MNVVAHTEPAQAILATIRRRGIAALTESKAAESRMEASKAEKDWGMAKVRWQWSVANAAGAEELAKLYGELTNDSGEDVYMAWRAECGYADADDEDGD